MGAAANETACLPRYALGEIFAVFEDLRAIAVQVLIVGDALEPALAPMVAMAVEVHAAGIEAQEVGKIVPVWVRFLI
jgi:hypothetical protein